MTPEELEKYTQRCRELAQGYHYDYSNPELEELVKSPSWNEIQKQLTPSAKKAYKSYFRYIADRSFGCLDIEIKTWELLVEGIKAIQIKMLKASKKAKK
ncbi:hypothetical protein [Anabaena sp. PCC 7108]|uniref:hypothetical protein n=1 Tax=Anabaena sp. PCC 7108 TaxID=163908 RepID=UPI000348120F|nr:hypothetical protein [Anabaena sp. PCC 7108]